MNGNGPAEILLVEDSLVEAELLRRILANAGYLVRQAGNGKDGLQSLQERPCALVISDIQMPAMNGYELCRAIKHDENLWHVPVILLSVLSEAEDIINAVNAGADSYLTKPCAEASLLARIHSLLAIPARRSSEEERRPEEVEYNGKHYSVTADSRQMLNLLLSLYENTLSQNRELLGAQDKINRLNMFLEELVQSRTAALRESEARYRRITEGLTDYLYTVRVENGRSVETTQSQACQVVTGYRPGDFSANPDLWIQMVAPEDRERVIDHAEQILAGENVPPIEHRIIRKDGAIRWVSNRV